MPDTPATPREPDTWEYCIIAVTVPFLLAMSVLVYPLSALGRFFYRWPKVRVWWKGNMHQ